MEDNENPNEYLYGLLSNLKRKDKFEEIKKIIKKGDEFNYKTIRKIFDTKNITTNCETGVTTIYSNKVKNFVPANPYYLESNIIGKIIEKPNHNINNDNYLFVDIGILSRDVKEIPFSLLIYS